ncbi:MAG TPA: TetR/AcrR family transcriptional regulator [Chitinophagales bacterium]|nr:TetR/AcrR family transcriptional regulator [Chitinophagales bacterium]HLP51147.1 TetR/AcrR family transcriptional regulator [Chitinophagales bacterium]
MKISEKQSEKRRAILDASLKLFCEKCFQDTSTASISQEANVGTGTLFCYFDSKEELVNELYLECKSEFAEYIETGVWEHPTFKLQLKHIFDRTVQWYIDNPRKIKFMLQYSSSGLITKVTKERAMLRMNAVNDVVKKAMETGEATVQSLEMVCYAISAYFHQVGLYISEKDTKSIKKLQDEAFSLIWKGLN